MSEETIMESFVNRAADDLGGPHGPTLKMVYLFLRGAKMVPTEDSEKRVLELATITASLAKEVVAEADKLMAEGKS